MLNLGYLGPSRWTLLGEAIGQGAVQGLSSYLLNTAKNQATAKLQEILSGNQPVTRQDILKQVLSIPDPLTRTMAFDYLQKAAGFLPEQKWIAASPGQTLINLLTKESIQIPGQEKPVLVGQNQKLVLPSSGKVIAEGAKKKVRIYNKIRGAWQKVPEDKAAELLNNYPEIYTEEPEKVTMSKIMPDGHIRKIPNVIIGSPRYKQLREKGYNEGEITGKGTGAETAKPYTIQQLVDDTRAYYALLMRPLVNPITGTVVPDRVEEYQRLKKQLDEDLQRIYRGEMPSWLAGKSMDVSPDPVEAALKAKFPDAFKENGEWYVIRDGKKYRIKIKGEE